MKTLLQILAALMFIASVIALGAGVVLGELLLGIGAFLSGLILAAILYALSDVMENLDLLAENQRRLIKAFNARENPSRRDP